MAGIPVSEPAFGRALFAGAVAGTAVDLSLYPIDTLKTRLQSAQGFQAAGGFRGVYRGVGSAALGAAPGAALFFATYERTKALLLRKSPSSPSPLPLAPSWTEPLAHMAAASAGEVAACAVRVPTEVVKQRAQTAQSQSSLEGLRAILASGGPAQVWRQLYRGWGATVLREVPFTVVQFPLWEALKAWRQRDRAAAGAGPLPAWESGLLGSAAGAFAAAVTTPLDVLKTRLMLAADHQPRMWPMLLRIVVDSGPKALFAGLVPRVAWISVGGFVFLGSYEAALGIV